MALSRLKHGFESRRERQAQPARRQVAGCPERVFRPAMSLAEAGHAYPLHRNERHKRHPSNTSGAARPQLGSFDWSTRLVARSSVPHRISGAGSRGWSCSVLEARQGLSAPWPSDGHALARPLHCPFARPAVRAPFASEPSTRPSPADARRVGLPIEGSRKTAKVLRP